MTEQNKLPIPRIVWVRNSEDHSWRKCELLADLSEFGLDYPFCCRACEGGREWVSWKFMREIEPEPEKPYMTPRQLLDAIRGGAVWRWVGTQDVHVQWNNSLSPENILLCYDWHGDPVDGWEEARVK